MITEADKAWLAGVFDSRGSIGTVKIRGARGVRQKVSYMSIWHGSSLLTSRIAALTGRKVSTQRNMPSYRRACAEHCSEPHVHIPGNTYNVVQIQGASASVVAWNISPYSVVRADDLNAASSLEYCGDANSPTVKAIVEKLSLLGWSIPGWLESDEEYRSFAHVKPGKVTSKGMPFDLHFFDRDGTRRMKRFYDEGEALAEAAKL